MSILYSLYGGAFLKDGKINIEIDLKRLSEYIQMLLLGFLSIFVIANELGIISINFGSYFLYSGFIIAMIMVIAFISFRIAYSEKKNINRKFFIVYPYVFECIYLALSIHTTLSNCGTIKELKLGLFCISISFAIATILLICLLLIMKNKKIFMKSSCQQS